MLRKFPTLPNIPLSHSYSGNNTLSNHSFAQFGFKYAATEVADRGGAGTEADEDEDMTDCSGVASETESVTSSSGEQGGNSSGEGSNLRRDEEQIGYEGSALLDPGEQSPEGEQKSVTKPSDPSEWQLDGGLYATNAAFEGTLLLEASLESIAEWSSTIVWKMFLRQSHQCTSAHRHQYSLPADTPVPRLLPKLLTKAMPRYKGGMTRAIAVTYALLYLHRIKTCFHCTRSSAASAPGADGKPSAPQMDITSQCSLFFSVGMHYASLWLLDCCPAEHTYWKRYVTCVPPSHGVAWSRLVLQHWNYQINVTVEEWLSFCSQVLIKFPFVDENARTNLATANCNADATGRSSPSSVSSDPIGRQLSAGSLQ